MLKNVDFDKRGLNVTQIGIIYKMIDAIVTRDDEDVIYEYYEMIQGFTNEEQFDSIIFDIEQATDYSF